jgi:hypothetical protein
MRASEGTLKLAAGSYMSNLEIGRLIIARDARLGPKSPSAGDMALSSPLSPTQSAAGTDPVGRLLAEAKVTVKHRATLPLVAGSSCHSVWIVIGDGRRNWYTLFVADESNPQKTRIESFVW